ncbi:MAG: 2-dehydropantoate 2-reductase [Candidatus Azotimanducaceae bacterium]|jgi:2-dehydropantoate 2-reductase
MGSLAAWRLATALYREGSKSTLLSIYGRYQPRIDHISQRGITFVNLKGDRSTVRVNATKHCPRDHCIDVALIFNKTYQLGRVGKELNQCLQQQGLVICLQNGVGSAATIQSTNPGATIIEGILFEGVTIDASGDVIHKGYGQTWLGLTLAEEKRHSEILSLMRRGGFDLQIQTDIKSTQWAKLAANAAINPLTALTGVRNKSIAEHPLLRRIASEAAQEVSRVADQLGVEQQKDYVVSMLEIAINTGENTSSMLSDIQQNRETEIVYINGVVVAEGEKHGIPTPVNQMLLAAILNHSGAPMSLRALELRWLHLNKNLHSQQ